jgi:hypothetical protein
MKSGGIGAHRQTLSTAYIMGVKENSCDMFTISTGVLKCATGAFCSDTSIGSDHRRNSIKAASFDRSFVYPFIMIYLCKGHSFGPVIGIPVVISGLTA